MGTGSGDERVEGMILAGTIKPMKTAQGCLSYRWGSSLFLIIYLIGETHLCFCSGFTLSVGKHERNFPCRARWAWKQKRTRLLKYKWIEHGWENVGLICKPEGLISSHYFSYFTVFALCAFLAFGLSFEKNLVNFSSDLEDSFFFFFFNFRENSLQNNLLS